MPRSAAPDLPPPARPRPSAPAATVGATAPGPLPSLVSPTPAPTRILGSAALALLLGLLGPEQAPAQAGIPPAVAAGADSVAARWAKSEHDVPMRDGVELHVVIYSPRDTSRTWPILMTRTPYGCAPYGEGVYPERLRWSHLMEDGYIQVCQDVRGRWMSEGRYENMRPHVPARLPVDESSDTYDTIEWLLANLPHDNGRVGMLGISYPGFYTAAALPEAHPALVASSPQAPIADFWFDDFHHRGAFTLSYFLILPLFAHQKEGPTTEPWYPMPRPVTPDGYAFYKELGPLSNAYDWYQPGNEFWEQIVAHPDYDEFWQARSILPHLKGVDHAVLTVGGWFDAEDLYGPLQIYRTLERENPGIANHLVMGPWSHGDWAREREAQVVGDIHFGDGLSAYFQQEVERPFFRYHLHGEGAPPDFEALLYDTGRKEWRRFAAWPAPEAERVRWHLRAGETLSPEPPAPEEAEYTEYLSDPSEPVPYTDRIRIVRTPRPYMAEDQRFAERRPDVIEFMTEPLEEEVTLAGDILAHLEVSTTGTDADWVVKLIDVYPDDEPDGPHTPPGIHLGGYQQMVRSEIMRGRWRRSFERPEPFTPGKVEAVEFPLQDVLHTFRAGHRIMVQVQSSWFPLFDLNPQTFVPNIYRARAEDFVAATHRVWHTAERASWVELGVLPR